MFPIAITSVNVREIKTKSVLFVKSLEKILVLRDLVRKYRSGWNLAQRRRKFLSFQQIIIL